MAERLLILSRKVILHYHIFKNAGTSIDEMLKRSLGSRWREWDMDDVNARISPAQMESYLLANPELVAVSSHQAVPPLPNRQLTVFPIIFLRHPIDRAYSAYLFEWMKQQGTSEPIGSFDAYVEEKLALPRRNAIEDSQTLCLANTGYDTNFPLRRGGDEQLLQSARDLLLAIPFLGVVEHFTQSMQQMRAVLAPHFPDLSFELFMENCLQDPAESLDDKLSRIRSIMSQKTYNRLVLRNQLDIRLYEFALALFSARARPGRAIGT